MRSRLSRQGGQGMVEYALILVLVSIVVIVILLTRGTQIQNVFSNVVAALGACRSLLPAGAGPPAPTGALFSTAWLRDIAWQSPAAARSGALHSSSPRPRI